MAFLRTQKKKTKKKHIVKFVGWDESEGTPRLRERERDKEKRFAFFRSVVDAIYLNVCD